MKYLILFSMLSISVGLSAQDSLLSKIEYVDQPYIKIKNSISLIPLTKESGLFMNNGRKIYLKLEGLESSTKILTHNNEVSIYIKLSANSEMTDIKIYQFDFKKDYRLYDVTRLKKPKGKNISYKVKEVTDNIYEIFPETTLEMGEYVILPTKFADKAYTFSITTDSN